MFSRIIPRRRTRPQQPDKKSHLVRFQDPAGPELTVAMAAGDALAFGGVRVDITPNGRVDVTPFDEQAAIRHERELADLDPEP